MKKSMIFNIFAFFFFSFTCLGFDLIPFASTIDSLRHVSLIKQNGNEVIPIAINEANNGNQYAQLFLGMIYQDGNGVKRDMQQSFHYYELSANQNNILALNAIGDFICHGWHNSSPDIILAMDIYRKCFDISSSSSPIMFDTPKKGRINIVEDIKRDSAESIADIFNNSDNEERLVKWYQKKTDLSESEKDIKYIEWYMEQKNEAAAGELISYLIESGHPQAKELSDRFIQVFENPPSWPQILIEVPAGKEEVIRNRRHFAEMVISIPYQSDPDKARNEAMEFIDNEAIKWFTIASDLGVVWAKNSLAIRYESGRGVSENDETARKLFIEAAENGNPSAQYNIGVRFFQGRYGIRDFNKAEEWLTKAKIGGIQDAENILMQLEQERQRIKKKQDGIIETTAYDLIMIYENNEISGDNQAKGKILEVRGLVETVARGIDGQIYVILSSGVSMPTFRRIQCFFRDEHIEALSKLNSGDPVIISGRCEGLMMNVILNNCTLIPAQFFTE